MTLKNWILAIAISGVLTWGFNGLALALQDQDSNSSTSYTKTTDEIGQEMIIITSTRDEGYKVHPSNQISKTTHEYYCEGYKVETLIATREENHEVMSSDLKVLVNGTDIDLQPIIGGGSNLFGYRNVSTDFACVDHLVRIIVSGQAVTHENKLKNRKNIIDFAVDRNTGNIKSTKRFTKILKVD